MSLKECITELALADGMKDDAICNMLIDLWEAYKNSVMEEYELDEEDAKDWANEYLLKDMSKVMTGCDVDIVEENLKTMAKVLLYKYTNFGKF